MKLAARPRTALPSGMPQEREPPGELLARCPSMKQIRAQENPKADLALEKSLTKEWFFWPTSLSDPKTG